MAYPLIWPAGLRPTTESWTVENADRSGGVGLDGSEQIISSGSGRVRAKLSFQLFRDETLRMRTLIAGLRGRAGTVLVGPFDMTEAPQPGTQDEGLLELGVVQPGVTLPADLSAGLIGTLISFTALRATIIPIRMPAGRRPVPGNYIGIGDRLHIITAVGEASATDFSCAIEPGLRLDLGPGVYVNFASPVCRMRLATPVDGLSIDANYVTSISLDLVEAF